MGAFNNRENADVVTLSFKGITELYKEDAQLHFLKAQRNKRTGRKYSKILSVTPQCFLLPFMLSYTFHVFKYALVICKRKININKSGGRWTIPRYTLCQECQCGGQTCGPRQKTIQETSTGLCIGIRQRLAPGKTEAVKVQK